MRSISTSQHAAWSRFRPPRFPFEAFLLVVASLLVAGCMQDTSGVRDTISLQDISGAQDTAARRTPAYDPSVSDGPDVPYVTTPEAVIDSMLALAEVTADDVVYDLGSGDGRIPIRAATKYGARGVGIEIRADLVETAHQNAKEAGVANLVTFRQGDLFEADISDATVVTLYLLPSVNLALRPKLFRELEPGTRVVSRDFHMREWAPARTKKVGDVTLYLWRIPTETPRFVRDPE